MLEGRAESTLSFGFYKVRDEGFPPFPKEKIDSGGFCGITFGIFTHTEVRVIFLFFFFFFFFFLKDNKNHFYNWHRPEHVQS